MSEYLIEQPRDIISEMNVLSIALNQNSTKLYRVMERCNRDDFYSDIHKAIFDTICRLYKAGKTINWDVVSAETENHKYYTVLCDLDSMFLTDQTIDTYIDKLKEMKRLRLAYKLQQRITKGLDMESGSSDILDDIKRTIESIENSDNLNDTGDIMEGLEDTFNAIDERIHNGGAIAGTSTGIKTFDKSINGLKRGELTVIGGRPAMGKSTLMNNIFVNSMMDRKKVILFNLEMSRIQILNKMLSKMSFVPAEEVESPNISKEDYNILRKCKGKFKEHKDHIRLYDDKYFIEEISLLSQQLARKWGGIDIIFIDYLQLVRSTKNLDDRATINKISRELKMLSKRLNCSVVALSQLSRGCESRENKRPLLSDLRESGNIEQDADNVHFVYRDEYYNKDTEDKGVIEVITAKQRAGITGVAKLAWIGEFQMVVDITKDIK